MFGMIPFERRDNNLFDMFDSMERSFLGNGGAGMITFRADIRDEGDQFVLEAELPGFRKEDIKLDLKDGILTISAQRMASEEKKGQSYVRRERRLGAFARSFDISGIDESRITAASTDGILALNLPKAAPVVPEAKRIEIQ